MLAYFSRFFVVIALSSTLLLLYILHKNTTKTPIIKIGTNFWHGYEILYLARKLGYLPDGVKLVEYNTTSEVKRSYRNGLINAMALTLDEALRLLAEGYQVKVIMVFDISNGADVVIAREDIKTPKDLKGKIIGVEKTALGAYMLQRFLEKNGLKPEDVEVRVLELHEHYRAFSEGKVDAVITFEPEKSKILRKGGRVIFSSKDIPDEIVDVLVVDVSLLKQEKALRELIKAYFRAYDYYENNKEEAYNLMADRLGLSPDEFAKSVEGMKLPNLAHNREMLKSGALRRSIDMVCHAMKSYNMLPKEVDCGGLLDEKVVDKLY